MSMDMQKFNQAVRKVEEAGSILNAAITELDAERAKIKAERETLADGMAQLDQKDKDLTEREGSIKKVTDLLALKEEAERKMEEALEALRALDDGKAAFEVQRKTFFKQRDQDLRDIKKGVDQLAKESNALKDLRTRLEIREKKLKEVTEGK